MSSELYLFSIQVKAVQTVLIFGEKKVQRLLPFSLIKYNVILKENTGLPFQSIIYCALRKKAKPVAYFVTNSLSYHHVYALLIIQ